MKVRPNIGYVVASKVAGSPARLDFAIPLPTAERFGVNAEQFCRL
jgi:hypothetical protein